VSKLDSFDLVAGHPQWQDQEENRAANGTFDFAGDGTFVYNTVDVNAAYPLHGQWQQNGDTVTFSASGSSQIGYTGLVSAAIQGTLDLSRDPATITYSSAVANGTAAVVNGGNFGSNTSVGYEATVEVTQQ
jgi:hypothetical protein